jgi:hypothetical protein
MSDKMALKIAIDLVHMPSQVRLVRSSPLPEGVTTLLRIAAGEVETETDAADFTGRSCDAVREAATFFIEQILFAPDADSYRVLGTSAQASAPELRRNIALLLRWLHPDLDPRGERSVFVRRVTAAWNDLKTPERRNAYDLQLRASSAGRKSRTGRSKAGRNHTFNGGQSGPRRNLHQKAGFGRRPSFFRRALSVLLQRPLQ